MLVFLFRGRAMPPIVNRFHLNFSQIDSMQGPGSMSSITRRKNPRSLQYIFVRVRFNKSIPGSKNILKFLCRAKLYIGPSE